jgi:hypothetical protein
MSMALYLDVHVPHAVAQQLRRRHIDVLTAIEDEAAELSDDTLLDRSSALGRIMVTFDVRFKAMAEQWQCSGRAFNGLVYAHPLRISIGQLVSDLELIAQATDQVYWMNKVEHLPL